ncbi:high affinity immunoglobulin gamma Fc receptor I-like isoform X2 [Ranitomeya imitator]|uniref:high affinity immunoglobulin gamma Fc receptor I-like isoform X2 n=1 Tax=Ranitomeya imitator TaxID=111125 RepID=UPI0037E97206
MFVISLSLLIIVSLIMENAGTVVSAVVTFNPNLNKIFTGESLQMTCNVNSTEQGNVTYYWFKNDYWIHSEKTFTISSALTSDGGNYQCQTSTTDRSDSTKLEVHNGYVILQTPPNVYEGEDIILRCHHYPGHPAKQTIFFKNNAVIKDWGSEDELHIENVNMTLSCKYKCIKQVNHHLLYYQHSDETSVSVQELFSLPTISLSPQLVKEGDQMTLTCHTRLSPHRQTAELQFAFYREGQNIQEFSSTNKYEILSAKLSDSGDYKCEVQTSNYRIKKASTSLTMQVNRIGERELFNQSETEVTSKPGTSHVITAVAVTSLVLVLFLFITALIFLYRKKHFPLRGNNHPSSKAEPVEPDDETENIYTDLDANTTRWQNFSQNPHKADVNDLVKENHIIVC